METMQDSGGLRVDGSKGGVASGLPSSKTVNQLRIVESGDESGKMVIPTKSEMDPYKELELYLAKVNVSLFAKKFLRFLSCLVTMLMNETS
ncbi:rho GTPase-activating protein 7 isoform X2 [Apis mellifera carnica]|nr:rho GTPase-activating protein 7 isoform X2 [Apis mellifera carnica]